MATLTDTQLLDCLYIPDFIEPGSIMIFENATAPVSWTKNTTHNDKGLRLISGSVTNGGTSNFSSLLTASNPLGLSVLSTNASVTFDANAAAITLNPTLVTVSSVSNTVGFIPNHAHNYDSNDLVNKSGYPIISQPAPSFKMPPTTTTLETATEGGGGQHTHSLSPESHTHTLTLAPHTHSNITLDPHGHPVATATQSFAVYYRDVILAAKD